MFRLVLCCLMFMGCSSEKTASVPDTSSTACEGNSSCEELSDCVDDACQGLDTRGDAPAVEEAHDTLETIGAEHRSDDTMQSSDAGIAPILASPCATALEGQGALMVGGVKYEFSTVEGTFHQALLEPNDASGCLGYVSLTLSSSDGCVLQAEFTPSPQERKMALSAMTLVLPEGCEAWSGVTRGTYSLSTPTANRFVVDVLEGEVAQEESCIHGSFAARVSTKSSSGKTVFLTTQTIPLTHGDGHVLALDVSGFKLVGQAYVEGKEDALCACPDGKAGPQCENEDLVVAGAFLPPKVSAYKSVAMGGVGGHEDCCFKDKMPNQGVVSHVQLISQLLGDCSEAPDPLKLPTDGYVEHYMWLQRAGARAVLLQAKGAEIKDGVLSVDAGASFDPHGVPLYYVELLEVEGELVLDGVGLLRVPGSGSMMLGHEMVVVLKHFRAELEGDSLGAGQLAGEVDMFKMINGGFDDYCGCIDVGDAVGVLDPTDPTLLQACPLVPYTDKCGEMDVCTDGMWCSAYASCLTKFCWQAGNIGYDWGFSMLFELEGAPLKASP